MAPPAKHDERQRMKVLVTLTDVVPAVRLNVLLEQADIPTAVVSPLDDIQSAVRREKPDLIVITGALEEPQQVAIVRRALWDSIAVVGLSDRTDPESTRRLRDIGYLEAYPKPVDTDTLFAAIRGVLDWLRLSRLTGLVGISDGMRELLVKVEQIAPVSSTVLIEGESGTGKELVARAIHRLSPRRGGPFIPVNVGALPDTLLESELFGHEKGAFTGAAERRLGRFELADNGTLFLDEIGEIPAATQVKLLRVLEDREVMRVGGGTPITVNVRVVAATNAPLRELAERGEFRLDLYYRLNVLNVYLPPLRERRGDIPLLVRQFIREYTTQHERTFRGISPDAMRLLVEYPWPGNVRELRNLVESMVVLAPDHEIGPVDLPRQIREGGSARFLPVHVGPVVRGEAATSGRELEFILRNLVELKLQVEELRRRVDEGQTLPPNWLGELTPAAGFSGGAMNGIESRDHAPSPNVFTITAGMTMAEIERAAIEAALRETRGNRRRAAELLAIGERTLYRKLKEYNLPLDGFEPE